MEIRLSQYQAVILNKAIDIFRTRKIRNSTLIDDVYVLQKRLAEWISVNISPTGNSTNFSVTQADSILAFNTVIQAQPIVIEDDGDGATDDIKDDAPDDIVIGIGVGGPGGGADGPLGDTNAIAGR